jgi:hypothetical protein
MIKKVNLKLYEFILKNKLIYFHNYFNNLLDSFFK